MHDLGCIPTSIEACREVSIRHNKKISISDYGTKGCYTYASGQHKDTIWYGVNGGIDEILKETLSSTKYRPSTHDCKGNFLLFSHFILLRMYYSIKHSGIFQKYNIFQSSISLNRILLLRWKRHGNRVEYKNCLSCSFCFVNEY